MKGGVMEIKELEKSVNTPVGKFSFLNGYRVFFLLIGVLIFSLVTNIVQDRQWSKVSADNLALWKSNQSLLDEYWEIRSDNDKLGAENERLWAENTELLQSNNLRLDTDVQVCWAQPEGMLVLPPVMDRRFCSDFAYHMVFSLRENRWYSAYRACLSIRSRHFMSVIPSRTLSR